MLLKYTIALAVPVLCSLTAAAATAQPDAGGNEGAKPPQRDGSSVLSPMGTGQDAPGGVISGTLSELMARIDEQEPIRRAGLRAGVLRNVQMTVPVVIVVNNAESYLTAISGWEGPARYPVLWDDGTDASREDIARFVRAFRPERVLLLTGDGGRRWGGERAEKQELFEAVLGQAFNEKIGSWREALDQLAKDGVVSPGIVVTDAQDPAWPAALALAAGRMQPVAFVGAPSPVWKTMSVEDSDALETEIERAARATGRSWEAIGDDIDAVTLALNTGTAIKTGGGDRARLATTDRIGRVGSMGAGGRWAWCGQIIGDESRAAYQAMCALFLTLDQGFVWDGYTQNPPWGLYDGTEAAGVLGEAGLKTELHDQPRYTIEDWKRRMVRPVGDSGAEREPGTAMLMLMNSKGGSNRFDLPGGYEEEGKPGHLPMLDVPAALHIVHSFSLQRPTSRDTVGGRFLERGVYLYAGSVDEPYLQGFVPTPGIARRLAGSMPFAAAVRFDDGSAWKITVLGDPLVTLGPGGKRVEGDFKFTGTQNLDERAKDRLKGGDFEGALGDLVLLGRDNDAARLAMALMKDKPEAFTPGAALRSMPALFRVGEYEAILDAYDHLDASGRVDGMMQDLLWLASPYLLARGGADASLLARVEALLRANLRDGQKIADAQDLAMHLRGRSLDAALGVLESLRPGMNENEQRALDVAIARVKR